MRAQIRDDAEGAAELLRQGLALEPGHVHGCCHMALWLFQVCTPSLPADAAVLSYDAHVRDDVALFIDKGI